MGGAESRLAKEVIAEIPDQILTYARQRGIAPNPPTVSRAPVVEAVHIGPADPSSAAAAEEPNPIPTKASVAQAFPQQPAYAPSAPPQPPIVEVSAVEVVGDSPSLAQRRRQSATNVIAAGTFH